MRYCIPPRPHRLLKEEDGSSTVEIALWLPIFFLIIATSVDFSLIFSKNAQMWDVARDSARRMATYSMDGEEAKTYAHSRVRNTADSVEVQTLDEGEEVIVTISVPIEDTAFFSFIATKAWGDIEARVSMLKEPI
ncbi:TadE/TadG family type IV pilus assembly protein [Algicella marina]|uniref:TadE-like domain-containing protein n=1 Tax=Algicella marina TaxID=2683284 RepID=A0A6P1T4E9_9RHOB|nr:TadE family protein [Algicella marina]QHQ36139.1 hypothetical protein GO499_13665 [Algicella marina]